MLYKTSILHSFEFEKTTETFFTNDRKILWKYSGIHSIEEKRIKSNKTPQKLFKCEKKRGRKKINLVKLTLINKHINNK